MRQARIRCLKSVLPHLLLHCDVASTLWNHVFSWFGMSWVMPRRVVDLFSCWWKAGRSRSAAVWKMVPICILWCVLKERNLRCFEDFENSLDGRFFVTRVY